jgi:Cu(I)/Ag(I) efflux system membrane protein CusA/SilA
LKSTLIEEGIVVALVIIIFLLHFGSSLVPIIVLPISVALAFIPMHFLGINSNIMSLGGIAIAIGAMVDASIVMVRTRTNVWKSTPEPVGSDYCRPKEVDHRLAELIITVGFLRFSRSPDRYRCSHHWLTQNLCDAFGNDGDNWRRR